MTAPVARAVARRSGPLLLAVERRTGLTPPGVGVAAAALVGLVLGQALGNRTLVVLVYGLILVIGVAFVLGRRTLSVDARRSSLPARVREGQTVPVELTVEAARRVSTVVLEEELGDALGRPVRLSVPLLPAGGEVRHGYSFVAGRRGVHRVGPLVAEWSDPFGLTRRRLVLAEAEDVIVHPATELVHDRVVSREWEDPPIRPPVSKPWPSGFEFYGMRDYVPGDDPRRIVWTATARTLDEHGGGRYLVREAEQGITDRIRIILDTDDRHYPRIGREPSEAFEAAVKAAASLGVRHLDDGFSVTLETGGAVLARELRGRRAQIPLLDALAAVDPDRSPLNGALERLLADRRRSVHNVVLTPHPTRDVATRLRLLLERGTSIVLVLIVTEDTEPVVLHRAGTLGCPVVELRPGVSFGRAFQRTAAGR